MSHPKKKKKRQPKHVTTDTVTKTYFDQFTIVVKKFLQLVGLSPDLFDQLSKKQKITLMSIHVLTPRVRIQKGHLVPRHHVKYIQQKVNEFLRNTYVGDPALKLINMDFLTIGMAFYSSITAMNNELGADDQSVISVISKRLLAVNDKEVFVFRMLSEIRSHLFEISKINFRIYGLMWDYEFLSSTCTAGYISLTSFTPHCVNFSHQDKIRPAYRWGIGNFNLDRPTWVKIPYNSVVLGSTDDRLLNVFVQSHALVRIKERLETMSALVRNVLLLGSILTCKMVQTETGETFFAFNDSDGQVLGYLPFVIEGDNLYMISFLPLCSPNVPEGSCLRRLLNIQKTDILFLGMDKLSFYQKTDFESIPNLKSALIEAGMWHLTEIGIAEEVQDGFLRKQIGIVSKFFSTSVTAD